MRYSLRVVLHEEGAELRSNATDEAPEAPTTRHARRNMARKVPCSYLCVCDVRKVHVCVKLCVCMILYIVGVFCYFYYHYAKNCA